MPTRVKFPAVGCKMNDRSYPFRGEYKVEPVLNHGHGAALPKGSTDLILRMTGSNLSIEKIQPRKGQTLHCELSVDKGPPRAVVFPLSGEVVAVPDDGREYCLTAVVQGAGVKHNCRMILSGSEEKSFLRLRAPLNPSLVDNIILEVDGQLIFPKGGWYEIPLQAKECSLELVDTGPQQRRKSSLTPGKAVSSHPPVTFTVQPVEGTQKDAVIFCSGSAKCIPLEKNQPITLPAESGPFIFQLPVTASTTAPYAQSGVFTASYVEPVEAAKTDVTTFRFPELETKIVKASYGGTAASVFVATAEGFMVELVGDNGVSVSGYGIARLDITDTMEHCVRITIKDVAGRIFLRQSTTVPEIARLQSATGVLGDPHEEQGISAKSSRRATVCSIPPEAGKTSLVAQESALRQPSAESGTEAWILQLAKALDLTDIQSIRRAVQSIVSQTPEAATILGFIKEKLCVTPPIIQFKRKGEIVTDIQCPGFGVTAAIDNESPCNIAGGGSVQVPDGHIVTLAALTLPVGRTAAACNVYFSPQEPNLDEMLIARLVETFQRHINSPEKVMLELTNVMSPQSARGSRLLGLLVDFLRFFLNSYERSCHLVVGDVLDGTNLLIFFGDQQQMMELLPNSSTDIPRSVNKIRLSVCRKTSSQGEVSRNEFAKDLVDAFNRQSSSSPLLACLASVSTRGPEEKALIDLLLQQCRDHENELSRLRVQGSISTPIDVIQFTAESGCLKNIRTARFCKLSVDIDETGFINIEQGAQVPQGYAFPSGSTHCIRIVARDPRSGAPCAETRVTLTGAKAETAASQVLSPSTSCFLDATVLQVMDEVHLHLVCPQRLGILCDVDGKSTGDTSRSDIIAKMSSTRPHNVSVRLVDGVGSVVFEQRLTLPPIMAHFWSLALDGGASLQVDTVSGDTGETLLKASVDRSPERNLVGPLLLDSNSPHTILLRRYFVGAAPLNTCTGELSLHVPAFINPADVHEVLSVYKSAWPRGSNEICSRLKELRSRITSTCLKELVSLIIDFTAECRSSIYSGGDSSARIHFRLAGDESTFARL